MRSVHGRRVLLTVIAAVALQGDVGVRPQAVQVVCGKEHMATYS